MKRTLLLLSLGALISTYNFAQTNLSGVINQYAAIIAIDSCSATLTLQDATSFTSGMNILLVQMQGATISDANNNNFGNITNLNSAGLYERTIIESVNGNQLVLRNPMLNRYQVNGLVQVVSIPIYENAVVTDTLRAKPWDGKTGGILAFEVTNKLQLNAPIDATGKGFRGGIADITNPNNCNAFTNANAYFYNLNNWRGATKGEGVAVALNSKEAGRGAQANGGGGGNDHNSGGGGGANVTAGGNGGKNEEPDFLGCSGQNPGIGGRAITFTDNRIFFGGGGGAGHENNQQGTDGGNGGGIIIIIAKNLEGNNFKISASGTTPDTTRGEGGGGGGAGGTIVLDIETLMSPLLVEAQGGGGGAIDNNNQQRCHGPGGGGAGGRILANPLLQFNYVVTRGEAGRSFNSKSCPVSSNDGQNGNDGFLDPFDNIPQNEQPKGAPAIVGQPRQIPVCINKSFNIEVAANGSNLQYQWQVDKADGAGFQNVAEGGTYTGTQTSNLLVQNFLPTMSAYKFRLQISTPCYPAISSEAIGITIQPAPTAAFNFTIVQTKATFNNTSTNADEYFWNFGDGTTDDLKNPSHTYAQSGDYVVTLTAINGCDSIKISKNLRIVSAPIAAFSANPTTGCQPLSVTFQNTSSASASDFAWTLPGATPAFSNQKNPTVSYNMPGKYAVTLIATNVSGIDTFRLDSFIVVKPKPVPDFTAIPNELSVYFLNTSSAATNYKWDFGDTKTSTETNPTHVYEKPGRYTVTLTINNDCGTETITKQIAIGTAINARFTAVRPNGCAPHTVNFSDASNGVYESRLWEFPGGNPATSTEANPRVVYSTPGQYDVKLIINGILGSDTLLNVAYVNVLFSPAPAFTFNNNGSTVIFNNESLNSTSYQWSFGDGQTSTQPNPIHVYNANGVYTVTLNASNAYCGRSLSRTVTVGLNAIEDLQASGILIFPNPTQHYLSINAEAFGKSLIIKLFSLDGKLIANQSFTKQLSFDMSSLANGMYLLQLQSEEKIWVAKVVKQ